MLSSTAMFQFVPKALESVKSALRRQDSVENENKRKVTILDSYKLLHFCHSSRLEGQLKIVKGELENGKKLRKLKGNFEKVTTYFRKFLQHLHILTWTCHKMKSAHCRRFLSELRPLSFTMMERHVD